MNRQPVSPQLSLQKKKTQKKNKNPLATLADCTGHFVLMGLIPLLWLDSFLHVKKKSHDLRAAELTADFHGVPI